MTKEEIIQLSNLVAGLFKVEPIRNSVIKPLWLAEDSERCLELACEYDLWPRMKWDKNTVIIQSSQEMDRVHTEYISNHFGDRVETVRVAICKALLILKGEENELD